MSAEFDSLEHQLNSLRPAHLPAATRGNILHEMERGRAGHRASSWQFIHRAGFQVALAGALSLTLMVGWQFVSWSPPPGSVFDKPSMVSENTLLPSLAFLEAQLTPVAPTSTSTAGGLRSPTILTNLQLRR